MNTQPITIADLYPDLPSEKQKEVEEAFGQFLGIIARTYEHIRLDPELYERFRALTGEQASRTIQHGRSFTSEYHDTNV